LRPLVTIYWSRLALAIVAATISTVLALVMGDQGFNTFMNGLTIALLVYLITYYLVFKPLYGKKVEKQNKLMTQGIGIYFFAWLVSWVVIYSIARGQPVP
jgi:hypothetical protein